MIKGYTEAISYLKTIKSLGIEDKKTKEFEKNNTLYRKNNLKSIFISAIYVPIVMFAASIKESDMYLITLQ